MCLTTKSFRFRFQASWKIKIASRDITVYKRFEREVFLENILVSPLQRMKYVMGNTYGPVPLRPRLCYTGLRYTGRWALYLFEGFHSYVDRAAALSAACKDEFVIECIIPKKSEYVLGRNGDIVSSSIRLAANRNSREAETPKINN